MQYGVWRTDKPADPGYSQEMISIVAAEHPEALDDFNKLPILQGTNVKSIVGAFVETARQKPNNRFLGTRHKNEDGTFGQYEWQTYADILEKYEAIARGSKALELLEPIPGINEDGKQWAFCGIWSKNRWECLVFEATSMCGVVT